MFRDKRSVLCSFRKVGERRKPEPVVQTELIGMLNGEVIEFLNLKIYSSK